MAPVPNTPSSVLGVTPFMIVQRIFTVLTVGLVIGAVTAIAAIAFVEAVLWLNDLLLVSSYAKGTSDLPSWLRRFPWNRALIEQTGADFGLIAPELAVLRPPTLDFGQTRPHAISFLRTRNKLPRANSVKSCARFLARPR